MARGPSLRFSRAGRRRHWTNGLIGGRRRESSYQRTVDWRFSVHFYKTTSDARIARRDMLSTVDPAQNTCKVRVAYKTCV
jgi:hypothetical protein